MSLTSFIFDFGRILGQFILDVIYFPVWWYTRGFFKVLVWAKHFLGARLRGSGLVVWLKNIFTPMYGQRDWAGLLISFITRVLQIIYRSVLMVIWLAYTVALICLWLAAPLYIIYQIFFQLHG